MRIVLVVVAFLLLLLTPFGRFGRILTNSRLPPLPPSVTMAMPYSKDAHTIHEDDDDSCEDTYDEEFAYVYVASDEEDVYTYSDDDSILSDVSRSEFRGQVALFSSLVA